jgi:hypothetical protein
VQAFLHFKARFQKSALLVRRQRPGDHPLETLLCQQLEAPADELGGRW